MNPHTRYEQLTDSNSGCADLIIMAERELSAFFNAVTQLFGSEQADLSAEEWLHELIEIDGLPATARECRLITARVLTRLAAGLNASSTPFLSAEFTNA
jgi:hypothetical protein